MKILFKISELVEFLLKRGREIVVLKIGELVECLLKKRFLLKIFEKVGICVEKGWKNLILLKRGEEEVLDCWEELNKLNRYVWV